ncbi:MAG: formylglycine-generating enzyme family protein [Spirochaetes bacterium]|nr:formylglycine-generating enzyme family protein [Spirochaetota bacterium]
MFTQEGRALRIALYAISFLFLFACSQAGSGGSGGDGDGSILNGTLDSLSQISKRDLVSVVGGTYTQTDGSASFQHTVSSFSIGMFEVTYELWYTVRLWATANGYSFQNQGMEGNNGIEGAAPTANKLQPVTNISWRDAIVWCNAYSQMEGLTPCYTYNSVVIKDSKDSNAIACDNAICDWAANGYRLPTEGEWQFAASNKGSTPWNHASGSPEPYTDTTETQKYAWYSANSNNSSKEVGTKQANQLGIHDMSGNVYEWCWDGYYFMYPAGPETDYRGHISNNYRVFRGGSCSWNDINLQIGERTYSWPGDKVGYRGFRVARSVH